MHRIKIELTCFGKGKSVGGWDDCEDGTPEKPGTNQGMGAFGNKLKPGDCALTKNVVEFLQEKFPGFKPFDIVEIDLGGGNFLYLSYADKAEWTNEKINPRVDVWCPDRRNTSIPDGLSSPVYVSVPIRKAGLA